MLSVNCSSTHTVHVDTGLIFGGKQAIFVHVNIEYYLNNALKNSNSKLDWNAHL